MRIHFSLDFYPKLKNLSMKYETSSQYHQHFTCSFFADFHLPSTFCKCRKASQNTLVQKTTRKILVKLTHSTSSFYAPRSQKRNKAA